MQPMNTRWTVLRRCVISWLVTLMVLPVAARTRPHYGGTLRVEIEGDAWQRPDGIARRLVYDGLTSIGTNGAVEPALAIAWESDSNDHRWQMRLRPGVRFHDGSPLTSAGVAASLTASCSTECPWTAVRAVGSAVVFTGDSPMPNLPALLGDDQYLIALITTADGKTAADGIGTGPFQLSGFNNGALKLSANENCWRGRPFADTVEIRVHRSIRDQWLDLGLGRADVVEVPAEQIRQAQQQHFTVASAAQASLIRGAGKSQAARGNCGGNRPWRAVQRDFSETRGDYGKPSAAAGHRVFISVCDGTGFEQSS
jgi:ABC-type transport system substrate-binding protein